MTQKKTLRYPIGIQTFETIRTGNYCYADKTGYIHQMIESGAKQVFLSRPRRFGKSLFVSTLEAYFQGRKELFEGLEISKLETVWESYPVLRFDLSGFNAISENGITSYLHNRFAEFEQKYGLADNSTTTEIGDRFGSLIKNVAEKTGKKVVVLIDEYDKGIVEVLQNEKKLENNIDLLRPFFSQLKIQDEYLRFVFLTGVSRFRNLTLFSSPNQLQDISMDPQYAAVCGMTEEELHTVFAEGIEQLAEEQEMTVEEAKYQLKMKYDSYRFTKKDVHVYNPFSVLNCLSMRDFGDFWLESGGGTSKIFIDFLKNSQYDIEQIEKRKVSPATLGGKYSLKDPVPLMYQTGYLTIASYDKEENMYTLAIPNGEVRSALLVDLAPIYLGVDADSAIILARKIGRLADKGDVDGLMKHFQSIMASIAHQKFKLNDVEHIYHMTMWLICKMSDINARSEQAVAGGAIDMVIETRKYVYVMEFKKNKSAKAALDQINSKGYALPWAADDRTVFKIGINFSSKTRNITNWIIAP